MSITCILDIKCTNNGSIFVTSCLVKTLVNDDVFEFGACIEWNVPEWSNAALYR